jgi:hypothetical protein
MKKAILSLAIAAGLTSFAGNAKAALTDIVPSSIKFTNTNQPPTGYLDTAATGGGDTPAAPEPSTYALFGIGAIAMLMVLRRKKVA